MPKSAATTIFLAAVLLSRALGSPHPVKPWETPLMDGIRGCVSRGDLRAADSLIRDDESATAAATEHSDYARGVFLFLSWNPDSLLSFAAGHRLALSPGYPGDRDLGLVLGYSRETAVRKIDEVFGNTEDAAVLKLILRAMIDFAVDDRQNQAYDPEWYFAWSMSPAQRRLNEAVLGHLAAYGNSAYGGMLSDRAHFSIGKYKVPLACHLLEGGGLMDGRDAGPTWWRSTSYLFDYRVDRGFGFLKIGRAVGGLGLGYTLSDFPRFALAPYAGIARYPFAANGEYGNVRRFVGPDLGMDVDWIFKQWKPPRSLMNLYLRTQFGVVIDPGYFPDDFMRTSFLYLNLGLGISLDIIAKYVPYSDRGRIRFRRESNWE